MKEKVLTGVFVIIRFALILIAVLISAYILRYAWPLVFALAITGWLFIRRLRNHDALMRARRRKLYRFAAQVSMVRKRIGKVPFRLWRQARQYVREGSISIDRHGEITVLD